MGGKGENSCLVTAWPYVQFWKHNPLMNQPMSYTILDY